MRKSKSDLGYQRESTFIARVREIYGESASFGRTQDEHLQAMKKYVWEHKDYCKLPDYRKHAVSVIDSCYFNLLYSFSFNYDGRSPESDSPLMAILIGNDGTIYGPNDDSWLTRDSEYKTTMQCQHVWRKHWNNDRLRFW